MKIPLRIAPFFLALVLGYFFFTSYKLKKNDTFSIEAISSNRPFDPAWEVRPLSPRELTEIDLALSQPYRYFGKGGQCYAFFSEDGKYVLKFFKQRLYKAPSWHKWLAVPFLFDRYKEKKKLRREKKKIRDFFSYKTAFEDLQEISGVLYTHLNPTDHLKKSVTLIDLLQKEHHLDLNQFNFILQKRGEMVYPQILRLLENKQKEQAKKIIDQILDLVVLRCQKGYEDWDPQILTNCGLLETQAMKIDVGRFIYNESMKTPICLQQELDRIFKPFQAWLSEQDEELASYCDLKVQSYQKVL